MPVSTQDFWQVCRKGPPEELVQWERKVTACVRRIKQGEHNVVLPAGTYHLWRHRGYSREEGRPPDQLFQAA